MGTDLNARVVIGAETAGARSEIDKLKGAFGDLRTLVLGALGVESVRQLAQTVDGYASMSARLRLVTKDQAEFNTAQKELFQIAQRNSAGLQEISTLYTRLAPAVKQLGGGQRETLKITEAATLALRISGATAEESASSILQLSQALGSGALRGDEFNSVAENSPRLMQALADSLGKPRGELRQMAEQGKLTADVVGNALIGQLGRLRQEAGSLPQTIGGSFTKLRNEFTKFVGESENVGAGAKALTKLVNALADNLKGLSTAATAAAVALAAIKVGTIVTSVATFLTSAGGLAATFSTIVTLLSGPVGMVALVLSLAGAFVLLRNKQDDAAASSQTSTRAQIDELKKRIAEERSINGGALPNSRNLAARSAAEERVQQLEAQLAALESQSDIARLQTRAASLTAPDVGVLKGGSKTEPNKEFEKAKKDLEDEAIKVQDLTRVEEVLREIQLKRFGKLTEAQEIELVQLAAIVQQKKSQEEGEKSLADIEQKRRKDAFDDEVAQQALLDRLTGKAAAKEQADQLRLIDEAFFDSRISVQEYDNALRAVLKTTDQAKEKTVGLSDVLAGAGGNSLASFLDDLTSGAKSFGDALRSSIAGFADEVRRFFISGIAKQFSDYLLNLLNGGPRGGSSGGLFSGLLSGLFGEISGGKGSSGLFDFVGNSFIKLFGLHSGGIAGRDGFTRTGVSPFAFALAPRFHAGGIVGLRSNEIPAILQDGEEVLTRNDPRHSANGGGSSGISVNVAVNGADGSAADQRAAGNDLARVVEGVVGAWAVRQQRPGGILYQGG